MNNQQQRQQRQLKRQLLYAKRKEVHEKDLQQLVQCRRCHIIKPKSEMEEWNDSGLLKIFCRNKTLCEINARKSCRKLEAQKRWHHIWDLYKKYDYFNKTQKQMYHDCIYQMDLFKILYQYHYIMDEEDYNERFTDIDKYFHHNLQLCKRNRKKKENIRKYWFYYDFKSGGDWGWDRDFPLTFFVWGKDATWTKVTRGSKLHNRLHFVNKNQIDEYITCKKNLVKENL